MIWKNVDEQLTVAPIAPTDLTPSPLLARLLICAPKSQIMRVEVIQGQSICLKDAQLAGRIQL